MPRESRVSNTSARTRSPEREHEEWERERVIESGRERESRREGEREIESGREREG